MRTGTRWTILVKLPVALSGGNRLNCAPLAGAKLKSPVANPSKIINAPINYAAHIDEAKKDQGIAHGRDEPTPSTIEDASVLEALRPILRG
jgi:2-keto-4-pentenoate hydratase/2-oxohepta-3-ene-1,7-dioic acid hydratase in catechol pathway